MKFYNLKCEVPGGLGSETIYDKNIIPWEMKHPHIVFDGWLGGEILIVSSCLLVSDNAMRKIMFDYSGVVGYETFHLEKSDNYQTLFANTELPKFKWLKVGGNSFVDDIALTHYNNLYNQLIISENLWNLLSSLELGNYGIEEAINNG